MTMKMWSKLSW